MSDECIVQLLSSRACERGTQACVVEHRTVEQALRRQADEGSPWARAILLAEENYRLQGDLMTARQEARALFQTLLNLWRDGTAGDREEAQLVLETLALDYGEHGPREAP